MTSEAPKVAGVDEAGRGPVLGPLVVAAVRARPEAVAELGVDDSKALSAERRKSLDRQVRSVAAEVALEVLEPAAVDEAVRSDGLNVLEAEAFAQACQAVGADVVEADACGPDADAFGRDLTRRLPDGVDVKAAHGADETEPLVSAASILAKVERDRQVAALAEEVGTDVGSGYPSDPGTQAFLETYVDEHGELPPGTRATWSTAEDLVRPETGLDAFAEGSP